MESRRLTNGAVREINSDEVYKLVDSGCLARGMSRKRRLTRRVAADERPFTGPALPRLAHVELARRHGGCRPLIPISAPVAAAAAPLQASAPEGRSRLNA